MLQPDAPEMQPNGRSAPDFGYTKSAIWLRLVLTNDHPSESSWLLYFRENFKQIFEVYVAYTDGRIETPLKQSLETGFETRPINYPELVAPLQVPPGETVTVLIHYWSEGASHLPLQIETPTSFAAISAQRIAKNYLYYGMMALLIIGALAALAIFRQGVFLAYVCYSSSTLLFLMHADGVAFQHLWPGFPGFNGVASIVTGSAIIVFGALYARVFLRTAQLHPFINTLLLTVVFGVLAIDVAALFLDNQPIKRLLVLISLLAVLIFTLSGIIAARTRFKEVRFYLFAWLGACLSAFIMTARHWFGIKFSQDFQYDSMRIVLVFDAAMMGLAIIDRYNQLRRSRQAALSFNLAQAERNLELSARLQELERQITVADEIARTRDDALQDAIHDLRQPLNALRLKIYAVLNSGGEPGDERDDIEATFKYLETLTNERLAISATPETLDADQLGLHTLLGSIRQMFTPDAQAKGLTLKAVPTSLEASAPALPLMRIISNLVANAIKFTDAGGVVIGVRRRRDGLSIEVHDSGPGMSAQEFTRAQGRAVRLEAGANPVEGHGLGLAIASQIANEQGWRLSLDPRRKTGAGVILRIPGDTGGRGMT